MCTEMMLTTVQIRIYYISYESSVEKLMKTNIDGACVIGATLDTMPSNLDRSG